MYGRGIAGRAEFVTFNSLNQRVRDNKMKLRLPDSIPPRHS
jgi:hypothetical protein